MHTPGYGTVSATLLALSHEGVAAYRYAPGAQPAPADSAPLLKNLASSNPANPAYLMDMPVREQWPIYADFDGSADNTLNTLPPVLKDARWLALRRVTKACQGTKVSFTLGKPATVYILATTGTAVPEGWSKAGFQPIAAPNLVWRDNRLLLVPATLYAKTAPAGATFTIPLEDRDALCLFKAE